MNANPHPQDCPALNVLFNSVKSDENNKREENFEDRGIGTIQDKYSYLWKNCQGLPNIFSAIIIPPLQLLLSSNVSPHTFLSDEGRICAET